MAVPNVTTPAVPLERRVVLLAVVGRWGLGLRLGDGASGTGVPTQRGKKGLDSTRDARQPVDKHPTPT